MLGPQFLTTKLKITPISEEINVFDFQLRDHFLNVSDLRVLVCKCSYHRHNRNICYLTNATRCNKCNAETELIIEAKAAYYHPDSFAKTLGRCCTHVHEAPCRQCLGCKTDQPCVVTERIVCDRTTKAICCGSLVERLPYRDIYPSEHYYSLKSFDFYICSAHAHYHQTDRSHRCVIHTEPCCERATAIKDYVGCFIISTTSVPVPTTALASAPLTVDTTANTTITTATTATTTTAANNNNNNNNTAAATSSGSGASGGGGGGGGGTHGKVTEYTIYDPSLWCKQSTNQFLSFLRAVIAIPDSVATRYQLYETSKFEISNLKRYKSGKDSIIRTAVIGFETQGVYQTSTISSKIAYNEVVIPQNIYRQLVDNGYDVAMACVKRDPSILPTCLYICKVRVHSDPSVHVVTISDQLSRGLNQDQDGDKNVLYFLRNHLDGWDLTHTYQYAISRLEMAQAMCQLQTLTGKPRYLFSENTLQYLFTHRDTLTRSNAVLRRCLDDLKMSPAHCNDVFAAYHAQSYPRLQRQLMALSCDSANDRYVTINDLCGTGRHLLDIVESRAKGSHAMFDLFQSNLRNGSTITAAVPTMIELCNKYIKSSQELSKNGRKQFVTLYAGHDFVAFSGHVYLNKRPLADLTTFTPAITFMHNAGSLLNFMHDLAQL